jgi:hypothetical protein
LSIQEHTNKVIRKEKSVTGKTKLILSPVNRSKCGKAAPNKKLLSREANMNLHRTVLMMKNRHMFRLMTVTATRTMVMTLSVASVMDYSPVTTKVKRESSAQNVLNGRTKGVTRERKKHLNTSAYLALIIKQGFLPTLTML